MALPSILSADDAARRNAPEDQHALVVYAHLGWDWVWQRPQQLLSRMAAEHHVYYVMEPWVTEQEGTPKLNMEQRADNLTLVWPVFSAAEAAAAGGVYELTGQLVDRLLVERGVLDPVIWLYTPLAEPVLRAHPQAIVVFDVMDELANFRFAAPELREREAALMQRADLVFTGGPSLYKARKDRHPRVHLFSSGVDRAHYAQAFDPATIVPAPVDTLPVPRIGFFGVIDERMDLDLIGSVAAQRPAWQLVLVGPVAKLDPAALPQAANIHYIGQRSGSELPGFCKGFDVCIMPFAINEATRFISPTKTLEYLAAGKPVVSTPIADVVELYSDNVLIAATPDEFVAAIEQTLAESPAEREHRQVAAAAVLAQHEWDTIAAAMLALIAERRSARAAHLQGLNPVMA